MLENSETGAMSENSVENMDQVATQQKPLVVIASNRGPFSFKAKKDGTFQATRGTGGLVTALGALAERQQVLWVAAALNKGDHAWARNHDGQPQDVEGIRLKLIRPNKKQYDQYYKVIANPLLWFIHHELWEIPRKPSITRETWKSWKGYVEINRQFADAIAESIKGETRPVIVFPQDYHLYLVPHFLREKVGDQVQIQHFVHIPWPGPDAWRILPPAMRNSILTSLLSANRVGFQTEKDAFNFVQTCRFYLDDAHSRGRRDAIYYKGRTIEARAYPISIDVEKVESIAEEPQTQLLKSQLIHFIGDQKLILRVDRIEPSKNILRGLEAFRTLLEENPEYRGKVQMLALLVPSRMEVDEYQDYLKDIMAESGLINAQFSSEFWEPVRVVVGNNYHRAIAAMQLYDVLLVNPIADGMNLVAKEGTLVNQRNGSLLLSENAGAYYEMGEYASTISPFDIYGTAKAMHKALSTPQEELAVSAEALRNIVRANDVKQWFDIQLNDALRAFEEIPQASPTDEQLIKIP